MDENLKNFEIDEFWDDCINDYYRINIYNNKSSINNNSNAFYNESFINNNSNSNIYNNESSINNNNSNNNETSMNNNYSNNYIKNSKKPISFKHIYRNKKKFSFYKRPSNIIDSYLNKTHQEKENLSNSQIYPNNFKNVKEALAKEELYPLKENKRQEKLLKKFINLYNKNKSYKDDYQKKNVTQKEKKEIFKIEECTFKPEKCKNKRLEIKINKLYNDSNIYERNIKQKKKHDEKVAFLYKEKNKITNENNISECFFHPYINTNKNYERILYDENNKWKEQANNNSNKLFLLRYVKAREEEFDKMEKLNNCVNKKLKHDFSYPKRMIKSLSQKDSLVLRQNLHNYLYSFKNLFTEDNENANRNLINIDQRQSNEKENVIKDNKNFDNLQWTFAKKKDN